MLLELIIMVGVVYAVGAKHPDKNKKIIKMAKKEPTSDNTTTSFVLYKKTKTMVQKLREIFSTEEPGEISKAEKKINQTFTVASITLGLVTISRLMFPPLTILFIPLLIYLYIPFLQLAYKAIFEERRVSSYILDSILVIGMLISGYLFLVALALWFGLLARKLLLKSEDNSKQNIANLFGKQPRSVWVLVDNIEIEMPFEKLRNGDIVIVSAGQTIPVDGIIKSGLASIDQHKLTGESQPAEKGVGDSVLAATVILAGKISIQTDKTGQETVAMQIGKILNQTADFKSTIQSRGEAIADQMTMPTFGLFFLTLFFLDAHRALAVLTNTFGYRMRLFAPASMLTFLNIASQKGVLIKDGRSLELLNQVDTIVFNKTGTLTLEQSQVGEIYTCNGVDEDEVLRYAAAAEYGQTHPIAKAIIAAASERQLQMPKIENARYEIGYGIQIQLFDRTVRVGSNKFMLIEGISIPPEINNLQQYYHEQGDLLIMVAFDRQLVGAISLHTTIRPEAQHLINRLHQRNLKTYIISGDHEQPTKKLAQALGIDHYFANALPEDKAKLVKQLQQEGRFICFVGDGINDSIALKTANVSISLQGAATIATNIAQIVLMDGSLEQFEQLFDIAQEVELNMQRNFLISTIPSVICLGGIFFFHWGITTGMIITQGTLYAGLINSTLPMFKQQSVNALSNLNNSSKETEQAVAIR